MEKYTTIAFWFFFFSTCIAAEQQTTDNHFSNCNRNNNCNLSLNCNRCNFIIFMRNLSFFFTSFETIVTELLPLIKVKHRIRLMIWTPKYGFELCNYYWSFISHYIKNAFSLNNLDIWKHTHTHTNGAVDMRIFNTWNYRKKMMLL